MLPWCVLISAVVQIGSMILRSECSATLSTVSALALAAKANDAASAQARRRPNMKLSLITRKGSPDGRIGRSIALRDLQHRLPVRQLDARAAQFRAGGDLGLVDAMPAGEVDGDRHGIGPALEVAVLQPLQHLLGDGMALAAVGRDGAGRA